MVLEDFVKIYAYKQFKNARQVVSRGMEPRDQRPEQSRDAGTRYCGRPAGPLAGHARSKERDVDAVCMTRGARRLAGGTATVRSPDSWDCSGRWSHVSVRR